MSQFRALLAAEFAPYALLSDDQLARLERHYKLLVDWNEKINLTRIQQLEDVVRLHYCESLLLGQALPPGRLKIADIGSGAGFPGIPVAVLRPECSVDLIESHQRKAVFLREVSRELQNVRVLCQRAESCEHDFDWVIARAVRPAEVISQSLARDLALLMSSDDAAKMDFPGSYRKVPWGNNRVIGMFHVE